MAGSNNPIGGYFIRSPRQASTIFGLDGASAPRQKSLFYVRFKQNGQISTSSISSGWQNNMGFLVKSMDQPSIQPQIEEVNQYNKKRQVTVGYKIQPLKLTLFDTADNMVMQMWNAYSKWYFGDFGQQNAASFSYDVTTNVFNDSGSGFGYQPRPSTGTDDATDLNSQFFFSTLEIYRVFGGQYTRCDLINPKITAFDPDELDYASSEVSLINMTLTYEAVLYQNNGQPIDISQDGDVNSAFTGMFNGDAYSVEGATRRQNFGTSNPNASQYPLQSLNLSSLASAASSIINSVKNTIGGGSLAQFGSYDFGSLNSGVSLGGGTAADISYLASGNNSLSSLLNLGSSSSPNPEAALLGGGGSQPMSAISGATYDATIGSLSGSGNPDDNAYADDYIQDNLVGPTAASASLSGNAPSDQTSGGSGLALNSQTYGIVNTQLPSYSQIGFNSSSSSNYVTNGTPNDPADQTIPPQPIEQAQINPAVVITS